MIEKLEWDSQFFGFGIAQWNKSGDAIDLADLDEHARRLDIKLVQAKVSIDDLQIIGALEDYGFHFVDLKVSFVYQLAKERIEEHDLEVAGERDLPSILEISSNLFRQSRFFRAPFEEPQARRLFATWAKKAIEGGFDDECLKLARGDDILGFMTWKRLPDDRARVGLVGVAPRYQGRKVGRALLQGALKRLRHEGVNTVEISTQGANLQAQNLYISTGARVQRVESWYYRIVT